MHRLLSFLFAIASLLLATVASAMSRPGDLGSSEPRFERPRPTLCETKSERSSLAPILSLRSEKMPRLSKRAIWIVPGETLCILASPSPGRPESEVVTGKYGLKWRELPELLVAQKSNAATLGLSLVREGEQLKLHIHNQSPYLIALGTAPRERHVLKPGEKRTVLIRDHYRGALVSAIFRHAVSLYDLNPNALDQDVPLEEDASFAFGPLLQTRISNLDAVYETLAPLGYEQRDNNWLAVGGMFSVTLSHAFMSFDFASSGRRWKDGSTTTLKVRHGSYNFGFGIPIARLGPLRLIPVFAIGSESLRLRFDRDTEELPAWTDGYKKPRYVRLTGGAGLILETMLSRSFFLRSEAGGRFLLGKGTWRTVVSTGEDNDGDYTPISGPSIFSHSPYLNLSLGFRFGCFGQSC